MSLRKPSIISVQDLVTKQDLCLPVYQRPYKWNTTHVNQLLTDVQQFSNKQAYRLGTIVIHEENKDEKTVNNIVDGQQRTVTLLLITKAILSNRAQYENPVILKKLQDIEEKLISFSFNNSLAKYNVKQNYRAIQRVIAQFSEEQIFFLYDRCEFVQFVLTEITEAFQFFDAQNARGKDLDPHDLLKAFHLREFSEQDISVQNSIVEKWENTSSTKLATLFANYLYRIKGWVYGNPSRYFDKEDLPLFKGIRLNESECYPYALPLRIAHYFTDDYNQHINRKIDENQRAFPFQLDQTIINGRRFFEFVDYYREMIDVLHEQFKELQLQNQAQEIFTVINDYPSMKRTGDQYTRALFDCGLLFYIDKFGDQDISIPVEKIFIWAYTLRLKYQNLGFASVDNYVVHEFNLFKIISQAITPSAIINLSIPMVDEVKGKKINELKKLFKDMKYYE